MGYIPGFHLRGHNCRLQGVCQAGNTTDTGYPKHGFGRWSRYSRLVSPWSPSQIYLQSFSHAPGCRQPITGLQPSLRTIALCYSSTGGGLYLLALTDPGCMETYLVKRDLQEWAKDPREK